MFGGNRQKPRDLYSPEQIRRVINQAGVDVYSEIDTDYIVFCPYHNNYRTPAGEIDKTRGTFFCFSCQEVHTFVDFIMKVTGKTYFETIRFIDSQKVQVDFMDELNGMLDKEPELVPFDKTLIERLHKQAMESDRAIGYFASRSITKESMEKYKLGYSIEQDMVTVPVMSPDASMYVGFVARGVSEKKFKNSNKLPRAKTMFNLQRAKRSDVVYVVESSFDAIRLEQMGVAAVATLGASVNQRQTELLLKYFKSIVVVADNDEAGKEMARKLLDKLGNRAIIINIPSRFKDIGDMTDEDIRELTTRIDDPLLSMYL